jgi:hypothetical protein
MPEESNLVLHAERELKIAGLFDEDSDYGGMLGEAVMNMVRTFSGEGHSGFSAGMAIAAFQKVASFEPLTPLTGDDDEWTEVAEGTWQNQRCSHVFKEADGRAYDIDGRIFREPDGACFTNRESRVFVNFPYIPTREYVDVPKKPDEASD